MKVEITIRKNEIVEIDKEILKQACKKPLLEVFEEEFEKLYNKSDNNHFGDIELYIDVDDIIADLIDEKYGDDWDDWVWA